MDETINKQAQPSGPESSEGSGSRWQALLATSLEDLWSLTGRPVSSPDAITVFRGRTRDNTQITIWHEHGLMSRRLHEQDNWRIHIQSPNRMAVSPTGEVSTPPNIERYELRGSASGEYHLYREIEADNGSNDDLNAGRLNRLIADLKPLDRPERMGA